MIQKLTRIFFVFVLLIVFFVFAGFYWWKDQTSPVSNENAPKSFLVLKGASARSVGNKLASEHFVKNAFVFRLYLKATGNERKILPGSYFLSSNMDMKKIVETLLDGPKDVWVLVPEGLRREQVVQIIVEQLEKKGLEKDEFVEGFMLATKDLEGFLFPDTYLFARDVNYLTVVKKMRDVFFTQTVEPQKVLNDIDSFDGYSLNEIVTIASLIERETKNDSEKPTVSGVLHNRLKIGMALQVDASVQYAVASARCKSTGVKCENWWPILTKDDLTLNSPYNTYTKTGIPPGPIANAGLSSIKAAIYPEKNDFLFYLHDKNGDIHTAKTFEEHTKNIGKYLR